MSDPLRDLFLDIGNSRIKWGYRQSEEGQAGEWCHGVCDEAEFASLNWPFEIRRLLVSCVRDKPALRQQLQQRFAERLVWFSEPLADIPLFRHCYSDHRRLGVDRWLAMLGAQCRCQDDVLVVDAGTALTLDLLDKDTQHQGGWIVAGVALAQQALFQQTERVNPFMDEQQAIHAGPGRDTLGCVSAGARRQLLALVLSVMADYPQYRVFVCGGDGLWLCQTLQADGEVQRDIVHAPELIFEGMESLCAGSFLP
ncbi:type III pantothenate kinase [Bacterioplanoides sp.]|uniref:type III pantothenate kinase n=1 Tax=Bacterioplanoides sp. TaxID=2066072 RepID=UPI003B00AE12